MRARAASAPSAAPRARAMARRRRPAGASARARRSPPPWRGGAGSSTTPPATVACGAVRAQDHAVAARSRHGLAQPQLREARRAGCQRARLEQRDARVHAGRADQDLHERAVLDARAACQRPQVDVEPVALGQRAGRRPGSRRAGIALRSTPTRLAATRWPASARSTGVVVHLDASARAPRAPRHEREPVAGARSVPDQSVPVTTVPIPRSVKARSIGRRVAPAAGRGSTAGGRRRARARSSSSPAPRARRGLDDRRARERRSRQQLLHVGARQLGALGVDEVALGQRDDGRAHAEQLEDRDVLARLRHHAVVAGDDDQREVDAGRAGDHGAHEALVPRHVDDRERAARTAAAGSRSRARSRCRAPAPRAAGRCRRR